jgi:hypothetical protein
MWRVAEGQSDHPTTPRASPKTWPDHHRSKFHLFSALTIANRPERVCAGTLDYVVPDRRQSNCKSVSSESVA